MKLLLKSKSSKRFGRSLLIGGLMALSVVTVPRRAVAHGVEITYSMQSAVEIEARYDSGTPMAEAQVAVYAPDNPTEPALTGTTDAEGRFQFTPDPDQPGDWAVKVRQAGHGDILTIAIGDGDTPTLATASTSQLTWGQKGIMSAALLWGCVGTAAFFAAKKQKA